MADTYEKVKFNTLRVIKDVFPEHTDMTLDMLYRKKAQLEAELVATNNLIEVAEGLGVERGEMTKAEIKARQEEEANI